MAMSLDKAQDGGIAHTVDSLSPLLKSLSCVAGSTVRRKLRAGDYPAALAVGADPSAFTCPELFRRTWLSVNLLKKADWIPGFSEIERKANCYASWLNDERLNDATNKRLRKRQACTSVSGDSLIFEMSRKIQALLGPLDLNQIAANVGFSAGSSTRLARRKGQPHNKIAGKPHVTPSALPYAIALARSCPSWVAYCWDTIGPNPKDWFELTPGGKWFTVPKNWRTERSCEQQPDLNLVLQKGAGQVIREKLQSVGIDLNDQTRNQRLAIIGSLTGTLATIDLASASNSVVRELVRLLLPPDWFDLLDALRCEWVQVEGKWHRLSMFSSMGNGFTFELESLIFWAACAVLVDQLPAGEAVERRFTVYGDDIIVPSAVAGWLIELLNHIGFRVNEDKSFVSGPFRESCGMHAFKGVDVTPFYCRKLLSHKDEAIRLSNRLRSWASIGDIADATYRGAWCKLSERVHEYKGPMDSGDGHLHSPSFPRRAKVLRRSGPRVRSALHDTGFVAWLLLRANSLKPPVDDPAVLINARSSSSHRLHGKRVVTTDISSLDEVPCSKWRTSNVSYNSGARLPAVWCTNLD